MSTDNGRKEIAKMLGVYYTQRFALQEKWDGDGPHDFRPGSARLICAGGFVNSADLLAGIRQFRPFRFQAIFGYDANAECREAASLMDAEGMHVSVACPGDGGRFWIIRWGVTYAEAQQCLTRL